MNILLLPFHEFWILIVLLGIWVFYWAFSFCRSSNWELFCKRVFLKLGKILEKYIWSSWIFTIFTYFLSVCFFFCYYCNVFHICQNIKKTFEDWYLRPATMLSQTASNSSDFQKFQGQLQQVRLGGRFNQTIRFKATK